MVFVAELAALQGRISTDLVRPAPHGALRRRPAGELPRATAGRSCHAAMRVDKKSRADRLRFVVLDGLGVPVIAESPAPEDLVEAYKRISA